MKERRTFNQTFAGELTNAGFNVTDIEAATAKSRNEIRPTATIKTIARWTGLPPERIQRGFFNDAQSNTLPVIEREARVVLEPWIRNNVKDLPQLQVVQLSRSTGLSPEKIIDTLSRFPISIAVNGSTFTSSVQIPEFPKRKLDLKDASAFRVSPKRVFKDALYSSRPRGGGAVQKSRLQVIKNSDGAKDGTRIDPLIRRDARKKANVVFELSTPADQPDPTPINRQKNMRSKTTNQQERMLISLGISPENMIDIRNALEFFETKEFKRTIPAKDNLVTLLAAIAKGERIPLVVFNCLDFLWEKSNGKYPRATILDDTTTSIVDYFQDQLRESISVLNGLSPNGSAAIDPCIIVPDSELLDQRVFPFAQSDVERRRIAEKVKAELFQKFEAILTTDGNPVMFWSEYCSKYGLQSPSTYTAKNANILFNAARSDSDNEKQKNLYSSILRQQKQSRDHFTNKGLDPDYVKFGIPPDEMLERIIWYCAMYMGEGQALAESKAIVLNFEDFRVGKWYNIGSSDRLPIVTPVNPNEYYRWRNEKK